MFDILGQYQVLDLTTLLGAILFLAGLLWLLYDNRSLDGVGPPAHNAKHLRHNGIPIALLPSTGSVTKPRWEAVMADETKGKTDHVGGKIKEGVGEVLGDRKMEREGRLDQKKGRAEQDEARAEEKAKEAREEKRRADVEKDRTV